MGNESSIQDLVINFLEQTNQNIFLTGRAGTGKTTFLHQIKTVTTKNFAVVAPTAVAAINAGGSTINSFFQIGYGPQIPLEGEMLDIRIIREKLLLLIRLELLIIEEISMVRADTLDYIDRILRQLKGSSQPFGGIQILMIGDLFQLPPIWERDWSILSKYYTGPFFFNSKVLSKSGLKTFELTKIYRQSDPVFISILNEVREGRANEHSLMPLNKHIITGGTDGNFSREDYVTLSTHVDKVQKINQNRLDALEGQEFIFRCDVSGDFSQDAFPAERELILKIGAQVMFIRNDSSGKKQYYNGRTARVTFLSEGAITVSFIDDGSSLDVPRETWQNVKFAISSDTQKIDETNIGTFVQYPLRLAWAITIHKSQGLTFDKVILDLESAFASGQTYVALSRCRSLEGILLLDPIRPENIKVSQAIWDFMRKQTSISHTAGDLERTKQEMYHNLSRDIFDMSGIVNAWKLFTKAILPMLSDEEQHKRLAQQLSLVENELGNFGSRFISKEIDNDGDTLPKDRIKAAVDFFYPKLQAGQYFLEELYSTLGQVELDLGFFAKYNYLQSTTAAKMALLQASPLSHSFREIQRRAQDAIIGYRPIYKIWQPKTPSKTPLIVNPEIYDKLLVWRKSVAIQKSVPDYSLISEKTLREIARKMPTTLEQLAGIKNFGEQRTKEYGSEIIEIINENRRDFGMLF